MQKRTFKTTRGLTGSFQTPFSSVDLSEYTDSKEPTVAEKRQMERKKLSKGLAYKITFKDQPSLIYISFQKTRDKAVYEACKYFHDNFYPTFMGEGRDQELKQAKAHRLQEFDKYSVEGVIPIPELMKVMGFTFPCSICGKDNFNYSDYDIGRCFLVEGEGDLNPFTKGFVLCYECYKKYIRTSE